MNRSIKQPARRSNSGGHAIAFNNYPIVSIQSPNLFIRLLSTVEAQSLNLLSCSLLIKFQK
ncbi:MAG: hypothetical protein U5K00_22310 [Melioribacteraceae bacterium]|nr:hypothetical protein [Melioribacteraceae bacterium]